MGAKSIKKRTRITPGKEVKTELPPIALTRMVTVILIFTHLDNSYPCLPLLYTDLSASPTGPERFKGRKSEEIRGKGGLSGHLKMAITSA